MANIQQYKGLTTELYNGGLASLEKRWQATSFLNRVIFLYRGSQARFWTPGYAATQPVPGLGPTEVFDGVEEFAGQVLLWRGSRLRFSDVNDFSLWIPVAETAAVGSLTTLGAFTQPEIGGVARVSVTALTTDWPVGAFARVEIDPALESGTFNFYEMAEAAFQNQTTVLLRRLDVTGGAATGTVMATGVRIVPLGANSAGEIINAGSQVNGDIWQVVKLGEYAYIFKNLSIQSVQAVGRTAGVFHLRPEVVDEGLMTPYSFCRFSAGSMIFLGQRELYRYRGGMEPEIIGAQATKEFFRELDKGRLSQIIFHHNDAEDEVWIVYPKKNSKTPRMLVFNYAENAISIDDYPSTMTQITSLGMAEWDLATAWSDVPTNLLWTTEARFWHEYGIDMRRRLSLIGATDVSSAVHNEAGGVSVSDGGTGYGVAPTVSFKGGGGTGATATATLTGSAVTSVAMTGGGSGYTSEPLVQFTDGGVTGAVAVARISSGTVGSVEVFDGGSGYTGAPVVVFTGGGGTGAAATATVSGGKVTGVTVNSAGSGYTSVPVVGFLFNGVRHAVAAATVIGDKIGVKVARVFAQGRVFSRAGLDDRVPDGYVGRWETLDFDFGDVERWKYVDTVYVSAEIKAFDNDTLTPPKFLYLQVGGRDNLDAPIRWSNAVPMEVTGGKVKTSKYNIQQSGRLIRLAFWSKDADIRWRIAGYRICGRLGETY